MQVNAAAAASPSAAAAAATIAVAAAAAEKRVAVETASQVAVGRSSHASRMHSFSSIAN